MDVEALQQLLPREMTPEELLAAFTTRDPNRSLRELLIEQNRAEGLAFCRRTVTVYALYERMYAAEERALLTMPANGISFRDLLARRRALSTRYTDTLATIGAVLRVGPGAADHAVTAAIGFIERLPRLFTLVGTGRLPQFQARDLLARSRALTEDRAHEFDTRMAAHLTDHPDQIHTLPALRERADHLIATIDPDGLEQRRRAAEEDRRVTFQPAEDGMGKAYALLTAQEALELQQRIDDIADTVCNQDERTLSQRRADGLISLVRGSVTLGCRCANPNCRLRVPVPAHTPGANGAVTVYRTLLHVIATDATLTGDDDRAGYLVGHGPITAGHVRDIAARDDAHLRPFGVPDPRGNDSSGGNSRGNDSSGGGAGPYGVDDHGAVDRHETDTSRTDGNEIGNEIERSTDVDAISADDESPSFPIPAPAIDRARTSTDQMLEPDPMHSDTDSTSSTNTSSGSYPESTGIIVPVHAASGHPVGDNPTAAPTDDNPTVDNPTVDNPTDDNPTDDDRTDAPEGTHETCDIPESGKKLVIPDAWLNPDGTVEPASRRPGMTARGATGYRLSTDQRIYLTMLIPRCVFPGCTRPAGRCQWDHRQEYDHRDPTAGGPTTVENLQALCVAHHQVKTCGMWLDTLLSDGRILWTSTLSGIQITVDPLGMAATLFPELARIRWTYTPADPDQHPRPPRTPKTRTQIEHDRRRKLRERNRLRREQNRRAGGRRDRTVEDYLTDRLTIHAYAMRREREQYRRYLTHGRLPRSGDQQPPPPPPEEAPPF